MIRRLTGRVAVVTPGQIVLDVNGVGYLIAVPFGQTASQVDSTLILWTHLAVRETALDLYGFLTREDLALFENLLTIPKIGPKSALQIMNQADGESIRKAVLTDDPSFLSKVSGIGKKTAEKVVVGLRGVFADTTLDITGVNDSSLVADTVDALITLGYPPADARRAVGKLPADIKQTNDAIKEALRLLGQL